MQILRREKIWYSKTMIRPGYLLGDDYLISPREGC
jgi:hypothetical protein